MDMSPDKPQDGEWRIVGDPKFWVQSFPLMSGVTPSFRDPLEGWKHYQIPDNQIDTLLRLLSDCRSRPSSSEGTPQ